MLLAMWSPNGVYQSLLGIYTVATNDVAKQRPQMGLIHKVLSVLSTCQDEDYFVRVQNTFQSTFLTLRSGLFDLTIVDS